TSDSYESLADNSGCLSDHDSSARASGNGIVLLVDPRAVLSCLVAPGRLHDPRLRAGLVLAAQKNAPSPRGFRGSSPLDGARSRSLETGESSGRAGFQNQHG